MLALALVGAVLLLGLAAAAQEAGEGGGNALSVPVFPSAPKLKAETVEDLANSYILLDDGSVLTVRDWIVGSLGKDGKGINMNDYDNRLFLGQVARAALGLDEAMVNRTPGFVGPLRRYTPVPLTDSQAIGAGVGNFLCAVLCGPPVDTSIARGISGGGFNRVNAVKSVGQFTWLGDTWFLQDMLNSTLDFQEAGTLQNMVRDAEKAAAKEAVE